MMIVPPFNSHPPSRLPPFHHRHFTAHLRHSPGCPERCPACSPPALPPHTVRVSLLLSGEGAARPPGHRYDNTGTEPLPQDGQPPSAPRRLPSASASRPPAKWRRRLTAFPRRRRPLPAAGGKGEGAEGPPRL